ncbi:unnamed protein product [Microthlaspi erraticum]|uniref:Uncharacterized protein n=1 Tax=Microthlaspi erraticum TaxID=1685480 RepID=A0A6D2IXF6_9BRAS|nr:unnamed protein product [Microthlaspi erraticum]
MSGLLHRDFNMLMGNDDDSLENLDGSFFRSSDEEPSDNYPIIKDTEKMLEEFYMSGYRDEIIAGKEAAVQQG